MTIQTKPGRWEVRRLDHGMTRVVWFDDVGDGAVMDLTGEQLSQFIETLKSALDNRSK